MRRSVMIPAVFMGVFLIMIGFGTANAQKVLVNIWNGMDRF